MSETQGLEPSLLEEVFGKETTHADFGSVFPAQSRTPTLSYTKSLENRIAELEAELEAVQNRVREQEGADLKLKVEEPEINAPLERLTRHPSAPQDGKDTLDLARDIEGLTMEDDGRISFHGPTSLFQLPSGIPQEASNPVQAEQEMDGRKERLINNAWRERAFEQLATIPVGVPIALRDRDGDTDLLQEPFHYLLDSHWCWIHPLFNFVYRPAFTRDMKINGPYYSDVLLNAILSHSLRWCKSEPKISRLLDPYDGGTQFFNRAVDGLYESLKHGNGQIPIVQSLLLLSAQECGRGNRTQAWLYSGMAFRLVEDLGITIDSRKYSGSIQFSDEDVEIRNRLFWSCYFWDKLVSLYFGRSPIIQDTPKWWNELPVFLRLTVTDLPAYCPPSHIVTLNCIYHITNILLHRPILCSKPFRSSENAADNANHLVQCLSSATSIISLYDLYRRTFGDSHVVLSLAYSLYTAASIFLLEIQALKYASASTLEKLRYCILALERVRPANPVINTVLGLVEKELQKLHINIMEPIHPDPQPIPSRLTSQHTHEARQLDQHSQQHTLHSPATYTLPPHGAFSITPPPFKEQNSDMSFTMDPSLLNPGEFSQQYDIAPELFEAFSYVEPMTTNVGTDEFDPTWSSSTG
ncbi:conserved hypothetical protein [Uncinocarpus reesii 1704]|uniref:Xylanolytic transcriptional activator regulatory domain-containing protein n=1 Tax=Uncinocarpus reesii (strain UAMH 1704) TaxID=336963 RepID=C4JIC1_UNCRE|nr:uncharacterized protein UREG_02867 [Uncinocarpus reesii 1704]EEP78018.1 conserved hypothetical protein [Uncinocarpus reesii 1704]